MEESYLSNKSTENLEASEMLIANNLFASSVHCSYYAMLQYMTCKLSNYGNISFLTIRKNSKGYGSHNYIISETINYIKSEELKPDLDYIQKNVNKTNIQKLKRKVADLKSFRVKSDYHNVEIDKVFGNKTLSFSKEIIKELNNYMP